MAVGVITSQESVTQRLKVTGGQRLNGTLTGKRRQEFGPCVDDSKSSHP